MSNLPNPAETPTVDVPTAAEILGISRAVAFQMANEFINSRGASGLPAIRCGRRIKVPSAALLRMLMIEDAA